MLQVRNLSLVIGIAAVAAVLIGSPAREAAATHGWHCASSGCKYAQGKVEVTATKITHHSWWGSTASGFCDPSNNVQRWRLTSTTIWDEFRGIQIYQWGPQAYQTNCTIVNQAGPPSAWVVSPNRNRPLSHSHHFWWRHEMPSPPHFFPYLRMDY